MKFSFLILGSSLSRYVLQFLCILLITRIHGSETAGALTLAIAIAAPIFAVSTLGMRNIILTHNGNFSPGNYMRVRRYSTLVGMLLSAVLMFVLPTPAAQFLAVIAFARFFEGTLDVKQSFWIRRTDSRQFAKSLLVFLGVGTIGIIGALSLPLPAPIIVLLILSAPSLVSASIERTATSHGSFSERLQIVKSGLPVGLSFAVVSLISGIPQYFLGFGDQASKAAVFAVYLYLFVGLEMVLNSVLQANYSTWSNRHRNSGRVALEIYRRVFAVGLAVFAPALTSGILVVPRMFGPEFQISKSEGIYLVFGAFGICASFAASGLVNVLNRYSVGLYINLLSVALALTLCAGEIFGTSLSGAFLVLSLTQFVRGFIYSFLAIRMSRDLT